MTRWHIYLCLGALILAALAVGAWFALSPSHDIATTSSVDNPGFVLSASDRTLGNPKAPIVLIE